MHSIVCVYASAKIYFCTHTCMWMWKCTRAHVFKHTHAFTHAHTHIHVQHLRARTWVPPCKKLILAYIHYTHTHTHTHSHIHTYIQHLRARTWVPPCEKLILAGKSEATLFWCMVTWSAQSGCRKWLRHTRPGDYVCACTMYRCVCMYVCI